MIENKTYEWKRGARGVKKNSYPQKFHACWFSTKLQTIVQIDSDFDYILRKWIENDEQQQQLCNGS